MPSASRASVVATDRSFTFDAKRMDILRNAAFAFAEIGYHQTSMNSLAERLGVSKPVLYYYAKNKDDLLFQCFEVARDALGDATVGAFSSDIDGLERVRRFFKGYAEIMCGDFGRCLALVDHRALSPETRRPDVRARREIEASVRRMIVDGQAEGVIAKCNPDLAARALFAAFNGIPRWFDRKGKMKAESVAQSYIGLFVNGLRHG